MENDEEIQELTRDADRGHGCDNDDLKFLLGLIDKNTGVIDRALAHRVTELESQLSGVQDARDIFEENWNAARHQLGQALEALDAAVAERNQMNDDLIKLEEGKSAAVEQVRVLSRKVQELDGVAVKRDEARRRAEALRGDNKYLTEGLAQAQERVKELEAAVEDHRLRFRAVLGQRDYAETERDAALDRVKELETIGPLAGGLHEHGAAGGRIAPPPRPGGLQARLDQAQAKIKFLEGEVSAANEFGGKAAAERDRAIQDRDAMKAARDDLHARLMKAEQDLAMTRDRLRRAGCES